MLAKCDATSLRRAQAHTHGYEVHQAWEGGYLVVLIINNMTTVELEKLTELDAQATDLDIESTKRPSVSNWFNEIMIVRMVPMVSFSSQYPRGPEKTRGRCPRLSM